MDMNILALVVIDMGLQPNKRSMQLWRRMQNGGRRTGLRENHLWLSGWDHPEEVLYGLEFLFRLLFLASKVLYFST
jgi:hypothetical protein